MWICANTKKDMPERINNLEWRNIIYCFHKFLFCVVSAAFIPKSIQPPFNLFWYEDWKASFKTLDSFPYVEAGAIVFRFGRQFSILNYSTWKMLNYESNNAKMHEYVAT